jgi:hypothetical protein
VFSAQQCPVPQPSGQACTTCSGYYQPPIYYLGECCMDGAGNYTCNASGRDYCLYEY